MSILTGSAPTLGFVLCRTVLRDPMAEPAKPEVTEEAKMDLLEDDDEFEEFEIDQGIVPRPIPSSSWSSARWRRRRDLVRVRDILAQVFLCHIRL